jgi:peptidoglycan hydrolase-like protein with peptidoglycan-binding domain
MTRARTGVLAALLAVVPAALQAQPQEQAGTGFGTPVPVAAEQPAAPPQPTLAELQAWERSWSREERQQVQRALELLGLYASGIDGVFGRWTRTGIQAFQQGLGHDATGYLTRQERVALSVAAALEAERRALAAADRARAAAAEPGEVHQYESGNVYRGDVGRDGYGVYEWTGGHRYEGAWDDTTRHGDGVLTLANGWRYAGQWRRSIFVGFGTAVGPDGTRQIGEWHVPQGTQFSAGLNGWGEITAADGSVAGGRFVGSVLVE